MTKLPSRQRPRWLPRHMPLIHRITQWFNDPSSYFSAFVLALIIVAVVYGVSMLTFGLIDWAGAALINPDAMSSNK